MVRGDPYSFQGVFYGVFLLNRPDRAVFNRCVRSGILKVFLCFAAFLYDMAVFCGFVMCDDIRVCMVRKGE